jgi:hypothetical protein
MAEDVEKERHPFRFLLKLGFLAAFLYFAARLIMLKKDEYYGLTETEARTKITEKLAKRVGPEKANEVADQVIPLLKDRGVVKPDPVSEAASELADAMADAQDELSDVVDDMAGAAEDELDEAEESQEKPTD